MGLRENAAKAAGREVAAEEPRETAVDVASNLTEPDLGDLTKDAESASAVIAWSRVMGEVRAIAKNEKFEGGRAGRFNFRGIETALNSFGPACRKHGVLVIQHRVETEYRDISTSSGGKMRECTALVTFRIYGPDGSFFESQAAGEASDSGGRSTPKAQSIALRTLLINNGLVPTEDRDADAVHFERAENPVRPAVSYVDEVCDPRTSAGRLRQIHHELKSMRQLGALVTNEVGDEEAIGDLVVRLGKERAAGGAE
ncbi:ERF family protein [Streptomyces zaomyceticus]|uniref:ERF family protein n=1 Tax=Streptomyces zaomyceticus TaxID=68286 RepID=UPI0037BBF862